jgi:hypothetical protein
MITRQNSTTDNLLPITDPEAIIRAGNAEKRCSSKLPRLIAPLLPSKTATTPLEPASMLDTTTTPATHEQTAKSSRALADTSKLGTANKWFKAVLKIQHTSIAQAQEDRRQALEERQADQAVQKSNSDRIGRLEDLLLAMNIKNELNVQPGR